MKKIEIIHKNLVNGLSKNTIVEMSEKDYNRLKDSVRLNGLMFISEHGDFSIIPSLITNIKEI